MTSQHKILTYNKTILSQKGSPQPKLISTSLSSGVADQPSVAVNDIPVQFLVTKNWMVEQNNAHEKRGNANKVTRVDKATQNVNGEANIENYNGSTHTHETDEKHIECPDSGCG